MNAIVALYQAYNPIEVYLSNVLQCGAPAIAKLIYSLKLQLCFMILPTIVYGLYKPTNISGGATL